jgi:putative phosphoribosyl transferase
MKPSTGEVEISTADAVLHGELHAPGGVSGIVVFAHGSGSSRLSPRNRSVARSLQTRGLGTLLFDLLTVDEERVDAVSREHRFDIALLARRLVAATDWLIEAAPDSRSIGYFGASTGAAAALVAAAALPASVAAIVSRGGRPDLAREALAKVRAPTLLIVGGNDPEVLMLNEVALERLGCRKQLIVIPGATHLFEESGALDAVAHHAAAWFTAHFDGDGHD